MGTVEQFTLDTPEYAVHSLDMALEFAEAWAERDPEGLAACRDQLVTIQGRLFELAMRISVRTAA